MYKLCKTEQSAARQKKLEQGLLQAMLSENYEEVSVSDLCDRIGVPRKSFYRYFSSKDGALMALLDHTIMEFEHFPSQDTRNRGGTAAADLGRFFRFWKQHSNLLEALERSRLSGIMVERSTKHALQERVMPRYLWNLPEKLQDMTMTFAVCGLFSLVIQWHHTGYQETPEEMARLAAQMLTRPLLAAE